MNYIAITTVVLLSCLLCTLNVNSQYADVENARQHGAQGQVTLQITDSKGNPVEMAHISVAFFLSDSSADFVVSEGQADTNGFFIAAGKTIHSMNYTITKEGYYKTIGQYWFYREGENCVIDDRWQPWNPTITVVLKEHRNPIPMYAKKVDVLIPAQNQAIGFDLEIGDWVQPYGQGKKTDLVFEYRGNYQGRQVYAKSLIISFSTDKDGQQSFQFDKTSDFMSEYIAPESGYTSSLKLERERTRTKILKNEELDNDRYLVIRIRTVTEKGGNIISANYGKLYSPIDYGQMGEVQRLMFTYYFNPTPNDRNLEFDPSKNLFGNTAKRRVYQP